VATTPRILIALIKMIAFDSFYDLEFLFMKSIPASEAKMHFGALLDTAQREPVTVSKQGRPVAVMMSIHDYEEMKLARLRAHLAEGEAQLERGKYTSIDNKQELHEFF
jgi:prevent-host-death family protein